MALACTPHVLNLSERKQHEDWFLRMNPNGRIPVIVDRDADDLTIFETGAIMLYLAEKSGKFMPTSLKGRYAVMQWLMFQMSGIGPIQGQAVAFERYFPEDVPAARPGCQRGVNVPPPTRTAAQTKASGASITTT